MYVKIKGKCRSALWIRYFKKCIIWFACGFDFEKPQANHLIRFGRSIVILSHDQKATFQVTFHVQLYIFSQRYKNHASKIYFRTTSKLVENIIFGCFGHLRHMAK